MGILLSIPSAMMAGLSAMVTAPLAMMSAFCCCCQGLACVCSTVNVLTCCCRGALGKRTGVSPRLAKIFYIIMLGAAAILAIILRFNATDLNLGVLSVNCSGGNTSVTVSTFTEDTYIYCKGDAAVFRISFILTLFFAVIMLGSFCSEALHRGFWLLKIVLVVGGIVGAFFMEDSQFDNEGYAWAARIGAVIFLILQILVLIDFAYQWNEDWVERAYADPMNADLLTNKKWVIGVLSSAALLYALSITGIALLYVFYASCEIGRAFTTVTVIAVTVITLLSVFRDRLVGQPGAILPTAVVCAYLVFLCWGSLESNPDGSCRPLEQQSGLSIGLGATWATVTLLWTTFSVTTNAAHLVKGEELEKHPDVENQSGANVAPAASASGSRPNQPPTGGPVYREDLNQPVQVAPADEDEDDTPVYSSDRPWAFHFIMVCASMYLAMLLTDWGTYAGGSQSVTSGMASLWVKIAAQWTTIALYTWTLVAPAFLTGRDFS